MKDYKNFNIIFFWKLKGLLQIKGLGEGREHDKYSIKCSLLMFLFYSDMWLPQSFCNNTERDLRDSAEEGNLQAVPSRQEQWAERKERVDNGK